jgi:hypothetical protein
VKELVRDFRQGTRATRSGPASTSDQEERLNGKLHVIIPHPEGKHRDCLVYSKRNGYLEEGERLPIFVTHAPENLAFT